MHKELATRILASIIANRLIVLCGAGLSMAPESRVPSAASVAADCYHKSEIQTGHAPPIDCQHDLEKLTEYFLQRGELDSIFTDSLMNWDPFNGDANAGHRAIADFLSCSAMLYGISTNIDVLIESAARELGNRSFKTAPSGVGMNVAGTRLLKIHGCLSDRYNILWCHGQLAGTNANHALIERIAASETWLKANLPNRDLIFIGFWSDWEYLNDILLKALPPTQPRLVVLVDPSTSEKLQEKAPVLWEWAQSTIPTFFHERVSGADFLDELRRLYSERFLAMLLDNARAEYQTRTGMAYTGSIEFSGHTSDEYYDLRRDATGAHGGNAVVHKVPEPHMIGTGAVHLMLRAKGAIATANGYATSAGRRLRVINGAGQSMSSIRAKRARIPDITTDVIICAGAFDDGAVANIVREGEPSTVVRPKTRARWLNDAGALREGLI